MRSAESPQDRKSPLDSGFLVVAMIALVGGAGVWVLQGRAAFFDIVIADATLASLLLPKIAGGIVLATGLGLVLPKDRVLRMVGPDSGLRGLVIAMVAGAVIPGGPAVTFPLAAGLMAAGADRAAGVAMVSGWMLLGLNRTVVWELAFLPPDLVLVRVLMTLPVPILLGLAVRHLGGRAGGSGA